MNLPRKVLNGLEREANSFAAYLLMPTEKLEERCSIYIANNIEDLKEDNDIDSCLMSMAVDIASDFKISPLTVFYRMRNGRIDRMIQELDD